LAASGQLSGRPSTPAAERTSPTNIGLALVSNQVAYNMGYITLGTLLDRQQKSLQAVLNLEKYAGHLFNWYETRLGGVLNPKYISTVDSGNLAASLIVTKEAIIQVTGIARDQQKFHDWLAGHFADHRGDF
jgi:cyclic beta-1,2-glucan synthetase